MKITIHPPLIEPPVERSNAISMIIRSFKGRRDVEVHLFRPEYDSEEAERYDWNKLIGDPASRDLVDNPMEARKILFEAFTAEERDQVLAFLEKRYAERVSEVNAYSLEFPIPTGIPPLSMIPEGKSIGFIRFERIPNFDLPFKVHGLYDLARHQPLVQDE